MCKNTPKPVRSSLSSWAEGALGLGEVSQLHADLSRVSFEHHFSQRWGKLFPFHGVMLTYGLGGPGLDDTGNIGESPELPGPWFPLCWSRLSRLGLAELQPHAPTTSVAPARVWVGPLANRFSCRRGDGMVWEG